MTPAPEIESSWTVRITFAWTGPREHLDFLIDYGALEHRGGHDYAWTTTVTGTVGPGTDEQREGRAMYLAEDALCMPLQDAYGSAVDKHFAYHSTELVREAGTDG